MGTWNFHYNNQLLMAKMNDLTRQQLSDQILAFLRDGKAAWFTTSVGSSSLSIWLHPGVPMWFSSDSMDPDEIRHSAEDRSITFGDETTLSD